ncbi:Predicted Zn-dependent peptidase [Lutibacter oricola]|uniref:Predicted Zn-dependent peptidase n=1 Tax=Lutibacter oricola TaxID=762486 RepID=A0A1H2S184_9FLAO|nr:insulinase family protein [Lutibacter oricola]SDW25377.1 Predicted Zn-dependent peptidase [Lutibacter oricola]
MKTKYLYILAIFFLSVSVTAQIDRSIQPKPGPAPKINLGTPKTFELKNGLKVLVVENHKLPRVSATLTIDNNPISEGDKAGVSSLLGSLLGSGTTNISKDAFNEKVDYLGASLSFGSSSARLNSLSKYFPELFQLMADGVKNPLFTQEDFDKEVNILLDGIKGEEKSVESISRRLKYLLAYGKNHPYGEFLTKESIENTTLNDVQNFYNTYYKPNNAYLIIVGDVNFKEIKKLVSKNLKSWKKGVIPSTALPEVNNVATTEINFINMPNAVQSDVTVLSTVDFKMTDEDYHALLLANQIFGGDFNSHLNMNLREAHGYTYGARSSLRPNKNTRALFSAGAQVRNAVTDSTVMETMKELNIIRTTKVTEEELKTVKATYIGSFVRNIEKPETVARYALNSRTNNLPSNFYKTYLDKINAVTINDIQRVAKKYFNKDNARIVVVGKAVDVIPNLDKLPYKINYFDTKGNSTEKPELTKAIPEGVTKETVFNNYLNAIGGVNKVKNIKTSSTKAEASMQGMVLTMENKSMAPNKQSVVVSGMGMVMSKMKFNGETGYNEQRGMKKEMTEDEIKKSNSSTVPFPEVGFITNHNVKLVNIEPVDGQDAYVVSKGDDTTIYYAVKSGLKLKQVTEIEAMGKKMKQGFSFHDYKEVNGIKIPHTVEMDMGPQKIKFLVKEAKINEGVTNSDFE